MELEPAELRRQREEFEAAKKRAEENNPIPQVRHIPQASSSADKEAQDALKWLRGERQKGEEAVADVRTVFRSITSEEQSQ